MKCVKHILDRKIENVCVQQNTKYWKIEKKEKKQAKTVLQYLG